MARAEGPPGLPASTLTKDQIADEALRMVGSSTAKAYAARRCRSRAGAPEAGRRSQRSPLGLATTAVSIAARTASTIGQ